MEPSVEKDAALGSPSASAELPLQRISDIADNSEAQRAAKRRIDEIEEKHGDMSNIRSEGRNVRMRGDDSSSLDHVKAALIEVNGHAQSADQPSSEPNSPGSFRTAHSTSDNASTSPSPEQPMDVDNEELGAPAYSHNDDSQKQNVAQTLSDLADTIRHPSHSPARPPSVSSPSQERKNGSGEHGAPTSPHLRSDDRKSGHVGNSPPVTRATRPESSALAAAAAAAKAEAEAEALASAQANSSISASRTPGFDSLARAIDATQQTTPLNEPSADDPSPQSLPAPSQPVEAQGNSGASPNNTTTANGSGPTNNSDILTAPMSDVVKVAAAAVAAQKSVLPTSRSTSTAPPPTTSSSTEKPSSTEKGTLPTAGPSNGSLPPSPNLSLTKNPYAITTQYLKSPGTPTTPGMPMSPLAMNPYAMYYAPGTPSTPSYSPYANPFYYVGAPLPSPNGMYSAGSNPPPTPSTPASATATSAPAAALPQQPPQRTTNSESRPAKPKRLKAHTVTSKSFSIPMVPRDKQGKPMLPLNVGIMTVLSLGSVCMREHFHTERYIFPVGYEVTRRYLSTIDRSIEVVYHCTILDGGDGPKFQIIPSDAQDRPVIAGTATGAWSSIVKQANAIRNRQHSNSVSGPDFFGLGQNTIKHLIQELPNARNLRDYVWQNFHEGGPLGGRHAAVIPALPEEYDGAAPAGGYYQSKIKRDIVTAPETPKGLAHYPQHVQAEARRMHDRSPQPQAGPSQLPMQPPINGQPLTQPPPVLQMHPRAVEQIAQALRNQAAATPPPAPLPQSLQADAQQKGVQYSDARSQPAVNPAYNPDPGIPPGANTPPGQGVPNTFASIMNAFPVTGGPPGP